MCINYPGDRRRRIEVETGRKKSSSETGCTTGQGERSALVKGELPPDQEDIVLKRLAKQTALKPEFIKARMTALIPAYG